MKKTEELLNSTVNNSSDGTFTSSTSSLRRNRMLTDTASAPNPSSDTRITPFAASSISVNTISTSDGNNSASVKCKTSTDTVIPITLEYLREHKTFCKLQQKQDKELTLMKKKHTKEQNTLGEQQSKLLSKVKNDLEKMTRSPIMHIGSQRKDLRYN
jgi:hypothetical protein